MTKRTKIFGLVLIVTGVAGYLSAKETSPSALIPLLLGMALTLLGNTSAQEKYFKKAIGAAALLALLGFIGSGIRVLDRLYSPDPVIINSVMVFQIITTLICAAYVGMSASFLWSSRRDMPVKKGR